jgi:hypothetical protein
VQQLLIYYLQRQIYQPPHRRIEEQTERQIDMEREFEDAYLAGTSNAFNVSQPFILLSEFHY